MLYFLPACTACTALPAQLLYFLPASTACTALTCPDAAPPACLPVLPVLPAAALSVYLTDDLLGGVITHLLTRLGEPGLKAEIARTYIQTMGQIRCAWAVAGCSRHKTC